MVPTLSWSQVCTVLDPRLADLFQRWAAAPAAQAPLQTFETHQDHLLLIDFDPAAKHSRYRHYGAAFVAHFGSDLTGKVIDLLPPTILPADQRGMLEFEYAFAHHNACTLWRIYSASFNGQIQTWQRLILPLGANGLVVGAYPCADRLPPDGSDVAALLRLFAGRLPLVLDRNGALCDVALSLKTLSDTRLQMAELEDLATRDSLTGVANLRHFRHLSSLELDHAQRMGRPLALLGLDIDHFKKINDTYGHAVGDQALIAFAEACRHGLRDPDILGRCGGEEFSVTLPNTSHEGALTLAERLRQRIEALEVPLADGNCLRFTVSIGVAAYQPGAPTLPPHHVPAIADLQKQADTALYQAKNQGRNRVCG
jgi:diguanylate cyclase (GGDEF)-like protein